MTDPAIRSPNSSRKPASHASYLFLATVSILTVVADLGSKIWAERTLETPEGFQHPMRLVDGFLSFALARNRGGAWGLLQNTSESIRKPFFMAISVAAIAFIVSLYRRLQPNQITLKWGLPLVLGGALGNLVDRIRYSWVIDFIDAHVRLQGKDHHWPTFNIADVAICLGVGLMALDMLGAGRRAEGPGSGGGSGRGLERGSEPTAPPST